MNMLRKTFIALAVLVLLPSCVVAPAERVGPPHAEVGIGIHVPVYPRLVLVPGYPVYYAPGLELNFFFYDGIYWVFHGNGWYFSYWYNGPWRPVQAVAVPGLILRVPLRYYRNPPGHFRAWREDDPPHWDEHWGRDWDRQRGDDWKHAPQGRHVAPLPQYQQGFSGKGYPQQIERQEELNRKNYHYEPQDPAVKRFQPQGKRNPGGGRDDGRH